MSALLLHTEAPQSRMQQLEHFIFSFVEKLALKCHALICFDRLTHSYFIDLSSRYKSQISKDPN